MRLENKTRLRLPIRWIQKQLDLLGVNPLIVVEYADDPKLPDANCVWVINGKTLAIDGAAPDDNLVHIYVGKWESGKFRVWTQRYMRWVIAHELRHQYQHYNLGNVNDKFFGRSKSERYRLGEIDANRYANAAVGVPERDYPILRRRKKNGKT